MKTIARRIPAEWEKHEFTLLSFPHDGKDWPGKYPAIKWVYIEIIKKIGPYEPVLLLVRSEKLKDNVAAMLQQAHVDRRKVSFIIKDTNRSWMRDSGPVIIKENEKRRVALNFSFNGWAKYPNYKKDRSVPAAVASHLKIPILPVIYNKKQVVIEGGAIDSNGCGTLLTTEECLLDKKKQVRNPGFNKKDYENIFREYMGISTIIWLGEGIEGDDTHGHVDDICRFVNRNTVIAARETNSRDKNYNKLEENIERLQSGRLENGEKLNIIPVPMPGRIDFEDLRLPASYVNFLILNGAVLVPVFNDTNDYKAIGIIKDLFPDYDVIGINAIDLVWGLGTLHCLSHEIPL